MCNWITLLYTWNYYNIRFPAGSDSNESANVPALQETQIQSLGREDPLEKGMATHSRILAWRIPRTEEPGSQRIGHDWVTSTFTFRYSIVNQLYPIIK